MQVAHPHPCDTCNPETMFADAQEMEAKAVMVADVLAALQSEEAAKMSAEREVGRLRERAACQVRPLGPLPIRAAADQGSLAATTDIILFIFLSL